MTVPWRCHRRLAVVVFVALTLTTACAGRPVPTAYVGDAVPVVVVADTVVEPASLGLTELWSAHVDPDTDALFVGDCAEGPEDEIVVGTKTAIDVFRTDGTHELHVDIPEPVGLIGALADVDDDGKADFILGSFGDSTSRVRVLNVQAKTIYEATFGALVDGWTRPQFVHDGAIYFVAGSLTGATPRVTGRADIQDGSIAWLREDGVLPTGLVWSESTATIGIHNRGVSRDLEGAPGSTRTAQDRSAVLVSSPDGSDILYATPGNPVVEGGGGPGQVSSVLTFPVRLPDGGNGAIVAENHGSSIYGGPSRVALVRDDGTVIHEYEGPPATDASLAILDSVSAAGSHSAGESPGVLVAWTAAGRVDRLDGSLSLIRSTQLPGSAHDASLNAVLALADGSPELLVVRDLDRLYLVRGDGTIAAGARVPGEIRSVRLVRVDDEPRLAVLADSLHLFSISGANSPVSDVAADSAAHDVLTPLPGRSIDDPDLELIAEALVAPGGAFLDVADMDGDSRQELVFHSASERSVAAYTVLMDPAGSVVLPERYRAISLPGDLDGDGACDIATISDDELFALTAISIDGHVLYRSPLTYGFSSQASAKTLVDGVLPIIVVTGYIRWPRGVYGVDPSDGSLRFFYPVAAFPQGVVAADGRLYVSTYTPANGETRVRPDGNVDSDDSMFVHVIRPDGTIDPSAHTYAGSNKRGAMTFFTMDVDGDGTDEAYATLIRDANYNPGRSGIFRVKLDGDLELLIDGTENSRGIPTVIPASSGDLLSVAWSDPPRAVLYGRDFSELASVSLATHGRAVPWSIAEVDDHMVVDVEDGTLIIGGVRSSRIVPLGWDDDVRFCRVIRNDDGSPAYLIVVGASRIAVLAPRGTR